MRKKLSDEETCWEYFTVLEPDRLVAYNNYFYKRTKCYRIPIEDPKAKTLSGYSLIEKDLRNCQVWLRHVKSLLEQDPQNIGAKRNIKNIENRELYNLVKGLFVASLTIYGKCFSQCEGRKVKLERSNLDAKFVETHDEAMSFRHNFAAHSGAKKLEFSSVVLVLDSKRKRGTLPKVVTELLQPDSWGIDSIDEFISLVEHAREFTLSKLTILTEIVGKDALKKGPDYWYEKVT